ncbi:hypothetical protein ASPBRDRAFT_650868 [Aspergillus brasiliensis CBS 101740]|uniref:Uncharacterized protein n=1 Tax=Aspergillus brasiliensis (strain CBS 101740 / IMI 381727 / IBT 21946) TaxID=767769 RepID=A0A1L9UEL6_ASPBC|nr:hypothetical protein ASPBRDRAFT_650868 [Aspergillus brasiliensis CBS 101740]
MKIDMQARSIVVAIRAKKVRRLPMKQEKQAVNQKPACAEEGGEFADSCWAVAADSNLTLSFGFVSGHCIVLSLIMIYT